MQCPQCEEPMTPGIVESKTSWLHGLLMGAGRLKPLYFKASSPGAKKEVVLRSGSLAQACKCAICGTLIVIPSRRRG